LSKLKELQLSTLSKIFNHHITKAKIKKKTFLITQVNELTVFHHELDTVVKEVCWHQQGHLMVKHLLQLNSRIKNGTYVSIIVVYTELRGCS